MCNYLHRGKNTKPIPSYGTGWKIFSVDPESGDLMQLKYGGTYKETDTGWVNWTVPPKESIWEREGFCFFLDEKVAIYARDKYAEESGRSNIVIKKIKYAGGVGSCIEPFFIPEPIRIEICKSFYVLPDEEDNHLTLGWYDFLKWLEEENNDEKS